MKRPRFALFGILTRGLMVFAALAYAFQGIAASAHAASDTGEGITIWHAHVAADGERQVHFHPVDENDGREHQGGKHDGCLTHAPAADLSNRLSIAAPRETESVYAVLVFRIPPSADADGPQRPPSIPDIA